MRQGRWCAVGLALSVVLVSGCMTGRKAKSQGFAQLCVPTQAELVPFGAARLQQDEVRLRQLMAETEQLDGELVALRARLEFSSEPYVGQAALASVALLQFRMTTVSAGLLEIMRFYRGVGQGDTPEHAAHGVLLALASGVNYYHLNSRLVALFLDQPARHDLLNGPARRYEVAEGFYRTVFRNITQPENIQELELAWRLANLTAQDETSPFAALLASRASARELFERAMMQASEVTIALRYVLLETGRFLPGSNGLRHSAVAGAAKALTGRVGHDAYQVRGFVFRNVARMKYPDIPLTRFSEEQIAGILAQLQPGDIVLTYTSGYMSNVFLPGAFKHGITYLGTTAERKACGLNDEWLAGFAVSEQQGQALRSAVMVEATASGDRADAVEAVAEGVIFSSLADIMQTHISRMVVLRPQLSQADRLGLLAELLTRLGSTYDFRFDFSEEKNLCCTELIYRVLDGKGGIDLDFSRAGGRWVLTADDLARYAWAHPEQLELRLLAVPDTATRPPAATLLQGPAAHVALGELLGQTIPAES
jgi:hypothetical protein